MIWIAYVLAAYAAITCIGTGIWRLVRPTTEAEKAGSPRSFHWDWLRVFVFGPFYLFSALGWLFRRKRS